MVIRTIALVLGLLATQADLRPASGAERLPNIVLIYGDDVGFGDVSANGSSAVATPNIDRIAADGLRFTDAHASAATCTPSRFAMLTGQYAFRQKGTGILAGNANLIIHTDAPTLPSLLKQAGYATGVVGKWHLGLGEGEVDWNREIAPGPKQIGFDYHFLVPATGDRVPCVYVEQGRVVDLDPADPIRVSYAKRIDDSPSGAERPDLLKQMWSHGHNQSIVNGISRIGWMTGGKQARWVDEDMADVLTHKATRFLEEHRDKPFFLMFATQDIHVPRVPHSRFAGKSGLGLRGDAILQLDACVGQLLDKLDALELTQDTLVIFTSDNGPVLDDGYVDQANEKLGKHDPNGPWRAGKYSRFEGGTRVPMLVRYPAKVAKGEVTEALFGQVDMCHSLAKLAGVKVPENVCIDSRDELDTLLGADRSGRPHLIHEAGELSLRMGSYKYVPSGKSRDGLGPWTDAAIAKPGALFDLASDPAEAKDLAVAQPQQLEKMRSTVAAIRAKGDR
ncbi:MAG: sulfatase family protein [Aureliella sp.]